MEAFRPDLGGGGFLCHTDSLYNSAKLNIGSGFFQAVGIDEKNIKNERHTLHHSKICRFKI